MVSSQRWLPRAMTLGVTAALVLGACGGSTATQTPAAATGPAPTGGGTATTAPTEGPKPGGTIYIFSQDLQVNQIDPQRMYTGEDLAFLGATVFRSLTSYVYSPDQKIGTSIQADLATDLGTATDGGKTWSFTLRPGVTWQDGSPVTCEDVKYGTSRTFATDVITDGPTYQIQYLDIPTLKDGTSAYKGPYTKVGQDLYDKAVTCAGNTITFHLNSAHADFNYATTLGFDPVRKSDDTGETYGTVAPFAVANGPYKFDSYTTGNGGKLVLVRNPKWDPTSDPIRKAYPDKWEIDWGIEAKVIDQRLMQPAGNDQYAVGYGGIQPENLATIFADTKTVNPDFTGRAFNDYDPYSRYYWIDVRKVKNTKIRQAMMVALDRAAIRLNIGGAFAGDFADGAVKPNIGADYAPTGLYDSYFGEKIPDKGDPTLAKKLIADSGEAAPALTFDFFDSPTNQKTAAIVIASLGLAGFTVTPNPIASKYYATIAKSGHEFGTGGWGADWPNASTVIAPLFTLKGGWDLAHVDDPAFNAATDAALQELDRTKQAADWQALNTQAAQNAWHIPTFFGTAQDLGGTKVGGLYRWPAYGSWPYGVMYVLP
jgi:peptide/nickel transport system substrate-binding protein